MRHGILAFVGVLTLICLAVGDEPKRLDDQVADETDEGVIEKDRSDLDIQIEGLQAKLEQLVNAKRRAEESGAKHQLVVRELIEGTERQLDELQAERKRGSKKPDEPGQRIEHIRIAAKYLKSAGMHDLAKDLLEKADEMEREVGHRALEFEETRRQQEDLLRQQRLRRQLALLLRESERLELEMQELRNLISKE